MKQKPIVLAILDGFGIDDKSEYNAIKSANTPNLEKIFSMYPTKIISASGTDVGLPPLKMGNSEVGHCNIGAGRIIYQDLTRIDNYINNKEFDKNKELINLMEYAENNGTKLHIMGLLSDGGVHSSNRHLYALLKMVKKYSIKDVCLHLWLDGRDTPPKSAIKYVSECTAILNQLDIGNICTISGRYYAMDRDNNWDRTTKAYDAITYAKGEKFLSVKEAILQNYANDITDEFIIPSVSQNYKGLSERDVIICFNFRPDRVRQITRCFVDRNFKFLNSDRTIVKKFGCFTEYDKSIVDAIVIFKKESISNTLGEIVSKSGLRQLRIAETEKYAHVTFFFNGGIEKPFKNEDRILIPSPKVSKYDLKPEMSAYKITDELLKNIETKNYDLIIVNYANCDMVGHTGNFDATIKAVETVDECIGKLFKMVLLVDGVLIITADHGNAEKMRLNDGSPCTTHTNNPVPFSLINCEIADLIKLENVNRLCDISPAILNIMFKKNSMI